MGPPVFGSAALFVVSDLGLIVLKTGISSLLSLKFGLWRDARLIFMRMALWVVVIFYLFSHSVFAVAARPNVILITLDTTRADRMGFLGSNRGLTPNLDAVAKQGIVFSQAYCQVPLTTPSHATILSGTYPQFSHVEDLGDAVREDLPYLPAIFQQHGYQTAAFVGAQVLDPKSIAAPGFDRGFGVYDAGFHTRLAGEDRYQSVERRAGVVIGHATEWINQHSQDPFFLWIHLYDPHDPYEPPEPFKSRYAESPYDGEIAYADSMLGKLIADLREKRLYEDSVIVVVADHGEAFGEHGERSHGLFLYDETTHVPLLIKLPANKFPGVRVEGRVRLVDIAPTLLQETGIDIPSAMQGESLAALWEAKDGHRDRPAYAETDYPQRAFGWSPLKSWRTGKYLYIDAPKRELYDQSQDNRSSKNFYGEHSEVASTLAAQLRDFREKTSGTGAKKTELTADQAEQLQALGYVSSNSVDSAHQDTSKGSDPKDKVELSNLLHESLLAMDEQKYQDAIPKLERLLQQQPEIGLANLQLGIARNALAQYDAGLPWLHKAVELMPTSGRAHYELGVALGETGDWQGSATQLEVAVAHAPDSDEMHFYLGMAYDALGREADAKKLFQETIAINPNHFRANLLLGRLLGMENNPQAALNYSRKAVSLEPNSADAHKFLANVYIELGDDADAAREQDEVRRLETPSNP